MEHLTRRNSGSPYMNRPSGATMTSQEVSISHQVNDIFLDRSTYNTYEERFNKILELIDSNPSEEPQIIRLAYDAENNPQLSLDNCKRIKKIKDLYNANEQTPKSFYKELDSLKFDLDDCEYDKAILARKLGALALDQLRESTINYFVRLVIPDNYVTDANAPELMTDETTHPCQEVPPFYVNIESLENAERAHQTCSEAQRPLMNNELASDICRRYLSEPDYSTQEDQEAVLASLDTYDSSLVTSLDLSDSSLTLDQCDFNLKTIFLCAKLRLFENLQFIDLSLTYITNVSLLKLLPQLPNIKTVKVDSCPNITDMGKKHFENIIMRQNFKIKYPSLFLGFFLIQNTSLLTHIADCNEEGALELIEKVQENQIPKEYLDINDAYHFNTPLLLAIKKGIRMSKVAKKLVELGANTNCQDLRGLTPLHWACIYRDHEMIRLLFDYKADPSIENYFREKPIDLYTQEFDKNSLALTQHPRSPDSGISSLSGDALEEYFKNKALHNKIRYDLYCGTTNPMLSDLRWHIPDSDDVYFCKNYDKAVDDFVESRKNNPPLQNLLERLSE